MTREREIHEAYKEHLLNEGNPSNGFEYGAVWADSHRWHKVADGDLPNDTCEVLICWETIKHERKWTQVVMFRRHADNPDEWCFEDDEGWRHTPDYWMEIPDLPK